MTVSLMLSLLALAASAPVLHSPATLSPEGSSRPFWISAVAATGTDGNVNYDVFGDGIREAVQSQAIPRTMPCQQYTIRNVEEVLPTARINAARSETIVAGMVTEIAQGFVGPTPGSLLTVHVDEPLSDPAGVAGLHDVFVSYLAADFEIGGTRFCNAGVPRNGGPFAPAVGDRILVRFSGTAQGRYLPTRDERLLFGRNDRVYAPRSSIPGAAVAKTGSFDELLRVVRTEQMTKKVLNQTR